MSPPNERTQAVNLGPMVSTAIKSETILQPEYQVPADLTALGIVLSTFEGSSLLDADDIGDFAFELAVRGWAVFPLRGKAPAISNPHPKGSPERQSCKGECGLQGHGVLDATTDLRQVAAWWRGRHAGANIGARVPDNAFVVDVDPRSGGSGSLAELVASYGPLPETLVVESGRRDGGVHYYFRRPDAKLTSRRLGPGLDLKTSRGYCVVPPSIHPDTGLSYVWLTDHLIAAPPAWLIDLLTVPPLPIEAKPKGRFWSRFTTSIADRYAETTSWAEILQPHGWRCLDPDGDAAGARWLHPTATSECSATVRHGCLFVYSPNTPFDDTQTGDPHGYTKFRAYAVLGHDGDLSAAARALKAVA